MMGQLDPNPRPAWAITAWISSDERLIFVELPMAKGGVPYIMAFDATTKGLMDALVVLKAHRIERIDPTAPAKPYKPPPSQPQVKVIGRGEAAKRRLYSETTEEQRSAAQALIERLGLKR
jgi:hypothetical protein